MTGFDDFADRFVTLQNGPIVPAPAYVLLLDLEARGCRLQQDGNVLVVGPSHLLTDEDRVGLRKWKWHLLTLVRYSASDEHIHA